MTTLAIVPNPAPTLSGLTTNSVLGGIRLTWVIPIDYTLFITQIWGSKTNDRSTATLIDSVAGTTYLFIAVPGETWYFWIRASNIYGRSDGPWHPLDDVISSSGDTGWNTPGTIVTYDEATGAWSNLSNVTTEDGNFATFTRDATGDTDFLNFYNFDFASDIDAAATITGIQVKVKLKEETGTNYNAFHMRLNWEGASYSTLQTRLCSSLATAQTEPTTTNTTYTFPSTVTTIDADWGSYDYNEIEGPMRSIVTSDVRQTNFGVWLVDGGVSSCSGKIYYIDFVAIKIFWEIAGGIQGTASQNVNGSTVITNDLTLTEGDIWLSAGTLWITGTPAAAIAVSNGDIDVSTGNIEIINGNFYTSNGSIQTDLGDINAFDGSAYIENDIQIGSGTLILPFTNEAGGSTGNKTINKISGRVRIAAAGTAVTVTNSKVTANSHVIATCSTNDTTAYVKNVVPGSGTFTINLGAAATAETAIDWVVFN